DVRLADGLALPDRQRRVLVGPAFECFVNEQVPRHVTNALQNHPGTDALCGESLDQAIACARGGHADAPGAGTPVPTRLSQSATLQSASCRVRSTLSGVTDTAPAAIAAKSVPGPASGPAPAGPIQ